MSFRHGKFAQISVNSHALSAFCDSADLNVDVDTADASTFGIQWKRNLEGLAGGSVDLGGDYDPTDTTGPAIVLLGLIGGGAVPIILYPGGNEVGQISHTFQGILTNYKESSKVGDKVTFTASIIADDEIETEVIAA